jgi:predicted ribosomally synthesized peptide with SipW-like signal peptide
MKKLFVLATLGIMAVLVFGLVSTGAWFTDSASIDGGQVTTGNLDLRLGQDGPWKITNIEPGAPYQTFGYFCAYNDGDYDMKWRGYLEIVGDTALAPYLLIKATANPEGYVGNHGPQGDVVFQDVPFNTLKVWNGYIQDAHPLYPFKPGDRICEKIEVKLLSTAPNAVQGKTLIANLNIEATQFISDAWSYIEVP